MELKLNPYKVCPTYESTLFNIRLVDINDAYDLLECYSDPHSAPLFNCDNCTSNFIYNTEDKLEDLIKFWLYEYKKKYYIRLSIIDKLREKAVGTLEFFVKKNKHKRYGNIGVLRIDLASKYEYEEYINDILNIINDKISVDFEATSIITKARDTAKVRKKTLVKLGYKPIDRGDIVAFDDYYIKKIL